MRLRRFMAILLTLCMTFGIVGAVAPERTEAAWDTAIGNLSVWHLDNDFKDGKFRFNIKLKYDKYTYKDDTNCGVWITDVKLVNSAGKQVASWKRKQVLTTSGETTQHYSVDFSTLPGGTYKFCYTLAPDYCTSTRKGSISVNHSAGSITFNSAKYEVSTTGEKKLVVKFNMKQMKGCTPKVQVSDADGNVIRTFPKVSKVSGDDIVYTATWGMTNDSGVTVSKGSYTLTVSCNGKSCSKKLNIDPN